ncbi:hypothetical protein [Scytonema hofmannii]|uniref:hypothetical protein n=1 Tax=Scytonema hofmannii TaxID=34078 RepID=UPI00191C78B7|nr:hypothetical protein [Scytonema hofmannii]
MPIVKRGGGSEVKLKNVRSLVLQRDFDEGVCQLWVENQWACDRSSVKGYASCGWRINGCAIGLR